MQATACYEYHTRAMTTMTEKRGKKWKRKISILTGVLLILETDKCHVCEHHYNLSLSCLAENTQAKNSHVLLFGLISKRFSSY